MNEKNPPDDDVLEEVDVGFIPKKTVFAQIRFLQEPQFEPRVKVMVKWFDLRIGAYIDQAKRYVYICPLPMVVIRVRY